MRPNEEVAIGQERAALAVGDSSYECDVSVAMRFLPSPQVVFRGQLEEGGGDPSLFRAVFGRERASLQLSSSGDIVDAQVSQFSFGESTSFEATLLKGSLLSGAREACDHIELHLINFTDFLCQEGGKAWRNVVTLRDESLET